MKLKAFYITVIMTVLLALAGCGGDKTAAIPATPDGTVKSVAEAIGNKQPQAIWRALPKSYQQDVNEIIRLYTEIIDEKNYNKSTELVRRVLKALKSKKEIFLGAMKKMPVPAKDVNAGYDAVVEVLELLMNSQLGSHSGLKNMDVDRFLADTGSSIMKAVSKVNPGINEKISEANNISVKVVSSSGDKAVVEITRKKDKSKEKVKLARVEGRWIPEDMSRSWKKETGKLISELKQKKASAAQMNKMVEAVLPQLEKVVVDLENVKNEADLMALQMKMMSGNLMKMMMMMKMNKGKPPRTAPPPAK